MHSEPFQADGLETMKRRCRVQEPNSMLAIHRVEIEVMLIVTSWERGDTITSVMQ